MSLSPPPVRASGPLARPQASSRRSLLSTLQPRATSPRLATAPPSRGSVASLSPPPPTRGLRGLGGVAYRRDREAVATARESNCFRLSGAHPSQTRGAWLLPGAAAAAANTSPIRSASPRLRGEEAAANFGRSRASGGIPWRQLPQHTGAGVMTATGDRSSRATDRSTSSRRNFAGTGASGRMRDLLEKGQQNKSAAPDAKEADVASKELFAGARRARSASVRQRSSCPYVRDGDAASQEPVPRTSCLRARSPLAPSTSLGLGTLRPVRFADDAAEFQAAVPSKNQRRETTDTLRVKACSLQAPPGRGVGSSGGGGLRRGRGSDAAVLASAAAAAAAAAALPWKSPWHLEVDRVSTKRLSEASTASTASDPMDTDSQTAVTAAAAVASAAAVPTARIVCAVGGRAQNR